ncbi:IS5 family transposase [Streptomyces olivaceus]|uniref:IS5 family transposase n=1 Tax=Streptomyces olivaceus TaxID=47716 RepID=UPI00371FC419
MGNRQSRPWIESLLPKPGPKKAEGRPRVPDRQALSGILFVLHSGIQWEYLPQELGFGSGMTCWRRLAAWNDAGVWDQLHQLLLNELRSKNQLDWGRAVIDSSHVRAARRGPKRTQPGRPSTAGQQAPPHRRRPGHPARGIADRRKPQRRHPTRAADRQDSRRRRTGRQTPPTPRPLLADRGYDHDKYRRLLWQRGIRPVIARRGEPHGTGLGIFRYVVERTIAWLHGFRRLRIRWERRDDIHEAFLGLAVCLITHRHVQRLC